MLFWAAISNGFSQKSLCSAVASKVMNFSVRDDVQVIVFYQKSIACKTILNHGFG